MKDLKLDTSLDEGWAVHVYDRNRRLRCTLEPSHGWALCTGLGIGILITLFGMNLNRFAAAHSPETSTLPPAAVEHPAKTNELLLRLD
ncbi:MAG: hypothetical protein AAFV72_23530 [Cyanobacteria bacterium J06635_1]